MTDLAALVFLTVRFIEMRLYSRAGSFSDYCCSTSEANASCAGFPSAGPDRRAGSPGADKPPCRKRCQQLSAAVSILLLSLRQRPAGCTQHRSRQRCAGFLRQPTARGGRRSRPTCCFPHPGGRSLRALGRSPRPGREPVRAKLRQRAGRGRLQPDHGACRRDPPGRAGTGQTLPPPPVPPHAPRRPTRRAAPRADSSLKLLSASSTDGPLRP